MKTYSTIYIACPANFATGGPELLHQLCHTLNSFNIKAKMYYYDVHNYKDPIHKEYKKYNISYTYEVDDNDQDLLIIPETNTKLITKYNNINKVIWWLSIDHFFGIKHYKKPIRGFLKRLNGNIKLKKFENNSLSHFVQSHYAKDFLEKKGIPKKNIYELSDFLNDDFINHSNDINIEKKENIVIYNPSKGIKFTKKLIRYAPEINWIPIKNMTRNEVIQLLQKAKVYIDFGEHPGKDRIPREAAISLCCVITGKKGSAKFKQDLPINESYKFDETNENIINITNKIQNCLTDYKNKIKDFKEYRNFIKKEKNIFITDVEEIFNNKLLHTKGTK